MPRAGALCGQIACLVFAIVVVLPVAAQDGSKAQIIGTPHDLSAAFDKDYSTCSFCHIPHTSDNSNTSADKALWWDHQIPAGTTYRAYSSPSLKASVAPLSTGDASQLRGEAVYSLICLSCHDGQTAVNVLYRTPEIAVDSALTWTGGPPQKTMWELNPTRVLGTDLSQKHPVNFTYDAALVEADKGLWDVTTSASPVSSIDGVVITAVRPTLTYDQHGALQEVLLFNGTLQCSSCHNPHSETNRPYLRVPIRSNRLCLKCHSTSAGY